MKQIDRISEMERHMERASAAVMELSAALDKYEEAQESISALCDYYDSDDWKRDFADDEVGRLPAGLKRGVLSEDGIWNLLNDNRDLMERIRRYTVESDEE
ncbi:MAG: DUF4298 domain-containing protein [Prevotella sp.]|nr:DUF4298 domain-containing protein [Prevotella sp.]MBR3480071.1 DUF4298 domain-containing protein [Prevotella sp.]